MDKLVWSDLLVARAKSILVSGRMIQEQALIYAAELGHKRVSGLNGWLNRWQIKRHNVRMSILSGEAADKSESMLKKARAGTDGSADTINDGSFHINWAHFFFIHNMS